MRIDLARFVFFSPTRTTRKVMTAMAEGLRPGALATVDLTLPEGVPGVDIPVGPGDVMVFGSPVYAGRLPVEAVARLRRFKGAGGVAVVVVVYGNRAFDDALLELRDLAVAQGFHPVAGAAFVGEHSFSAPQTPIAAGRPDAGDLAKARAFGAALRDRIAAIEDPAALPELSVPGNHPYRDGLPASDIAPVTLDDRCVRCGLCTTVCPTSAARLTDDGVLTDASRCLHCYACVRACPCEARVMENSVMRQFAERLHAGCQARKEPETFF